MTVRPERALYMRLRDYCFERRLSHNAVAIEALAAYLDEQEKMPSCRKDSADYRTTRGR